MKCQLFAITSIVLITLMHFQLLYAAPMHNNDIDYNDVGADGVVGNGRHYMRNNYGNSNTQIDYNTIFGHVKDFFMYLPVMMTTLKETMNGFPKFAEGVRILTSKDPRIESSDCNCDRGSGEVSSRYG